MTMTENTKDILKILLISVFVTAAVTSAMAWSGHHVFAGMTDRQRCVHGDTWSCVAVMDRRDKALAAGDTALAEEIMKGEK